MDANLSSEYDVTDQVRVSDPDEVCAAVLDIFASIYPGVPTERLKTTFNDFHRMFTGRLPGYVGCDTIYHDMQHSLDVTLAMMRLIAGHEKAADGEILLGAEHAELGVIAALYHDSGYIRRSNDTEHRNGAEYTSSHIARGGEFLENYLPTIGLKHVVSAAKELIHYTGYERPLDSLRLPDPRHVQLGRLLGTADLIAQMADRCYLEKCRDRLYSEFVLGGVAVTQRTDGSPDVLYASGLDLLRKTPEFFAKVYDERLDGDFCGVYRYFAVWHGGINPYLEAIQKNLNFLEEVLENDDWESLRRTPPCFTSEERSVDDTQTMVVDQLRKLFNDA